MSQSSNAGDPHNLNRFVKEQKVDYEQALAEVKSGQALALDVVRLSPIRWARVQSAIPAVFNQERRRS